MEQWLVLTVAGFALVIAELVTGTFYLLVIGLGAFAGAIAAWLGMNLVLQATVGSAIAIGGAFAVHHWHLRQRAGDPKNSNLLDRGQAVVLEGWANETARICRVKYRGTTWDARLVRPDDRPVPGTTLYIEAQEGNTLVVGAAPPAR